MATNTTDGSPMSAGATVSPDLPSEYVDVITGFFRNVGAVSTIRPEHNFKESFSNIIGGSLKVIAIEKGKISCLLIVKPHILLIEHLESLWWNARRFSWDCVRNGCNCVCSNCCWRR